MTAEQQAHFRLSQILKQNPGYSQSDIAEVVVGMSLGCTDYVIDALVKKGFLEVGNFLKTDEKLTKNACILTPTCSRHRMKLTHGHIRRKKMEYEVGAAEC